jgi:hypothetical protein
MRKGAQRVVSHSLTLELETMKTTITKSVPAKRTNGIPADDHPLAKLSFVKRSWDSRTKDYLVTDWFAVPLEIYYDGKATGYRLMAELLAWSEQHPSEGNAAFKGVLKAAFAAESLPSKQTGRFEPIDKRGAAVAVLELAASYLGFAALHANYSMFIAGCIAKEEGLRAFFAKRDAEYRREFVARMQAARASKSTAKKFTGLANSENTSSTSSKNKKFNKNNALA